MKSVNSAERGKSWAKQKKHSMYVSITDISNAITRGQEKTL